MAKVHGKGSGIVIDGFDIACYANAASLSMSADTAECTTFCDTAKAYVEGDMGWTASFAGFLDDEGDTGWDYAAFDKMVTTRDDDHVLCLEVPSAGAAHTLGNVVYTGVFRWTGEPRTFSIGDAIVLAGDMQGTGELSRGHVACTGTLSTTGAQTGYEMGATLATVTTTATYHILAVDGTGTIAMTINESSDDGSTDAYAQINAALASGDLTEAHVGTAIRKSYTGATEAWKQVEVTTFDTFTSVTVLVTVTIDTV